MQLAAVEYADATASLSPGRQIRFGAAQHKVRLQDGELPKFSSSEQPGSGRPPPWGPDKEDEARIEVILFDSDSSIESRKRGSPDASVKKLRPPAEGSGWLERRRGGRYSLRPTTPKKYTWDSIEEEEIGFAADGDFEIYEETVAKELQQDEKLPQWGRKKRRTVKWCSFEGSSDASCLPASKQATRSRNLLDCGATKTSQGGLPTWYNRQRTSKLPPLSWNDGGLRALRSKSAALKDEISVKKTRSGRSRHEGNAVAVHGEVGRGFRLRFLKRKRSSCKRKKVGRKGKMGTQIETLLRQFGGPAAPIKPKPTRKRKGVPLADQTLECQRTNVLTNRRSSWPDSSERPTQQQFQLLSSDGENVEGPSRKVADLLVQSPKLPSSLHVSEFDNLDNFVTGEYCREGVYGVFDEYVSGEMCRPSLAPTGSQFNYETGPSPNRTLTLNTFAANIGSNPRWRSQGEGDKYWVQDRDAFSIASEPSANDSFEASQSEARQTSDDDYRPPARYSNFQPLTGNVDTPIPPSTRRRRGGATQRDPEFATFLDSLQRAQVTPNQGTIQPGPDAFAAVHVNPVTASQHGSFSTTISPSANGVGNLDVLEDLETDEPNDGNVLDEEEAQDEVLFDLNELPEEQARKTSKGRKKHRPKVFREGRPYRARKPKKTEENIPKTKVSEGQKVAEKPRARKKRATADLRSLDKQGGQSTPVAANCGPIGTDPPGCAQCQENQRVLASGVLSPERRAVSDQGLVQSRGEHDISRCLQTPAPEGMLVEANNRLIYCSGETCSLHARDGSPLSISSSAAPCLSRKRTGELDSLPVSKAPASRRGASRRELFKNARGKRSATGGKENSGLGESCQESLNVASAHSKIVEPVPQTNSDPSECQALVPLEPLARPVNAAAAGAGSIAAENPKRHDPRKPQADVTGESHILPNEVGTIDGSTITSEGIVAHATNIRLRAAARAKFRRPTPSTRAKKRPTRFPSGPRSRRTDPATPLEQIQSRMAQLELNECVSGLEMVPHVIQHSALVPYEGPFMPLRRKKSRARVMLDGEDKRVWRLLMAQGTSFEDHDAEKDAPKMWEEERALMKCRAERFINRMHLVQGDRRFSVWKGSVIDSVVGAFLTQNVSDHLSSSAFMCLAARFPVPRKKKATAEASQETPFTEVRVEEAFEEISQKSSGFPGSSSTAAVVQETSVTTFHVEEAVDVSEKSSVMGGESCISCHQQDLDALSTKATDSNCGSEQACHCCKERVGSISHNYTAITGNSFSELISTWSTEVREQNSSCSSKASQSQCNSCFPIEISQATKCLDGRGNGQVKPSRAVEDFTSLHSGLEDVLLASSGDSQVNSTCHTVLVDSREREVHELVLPPSKAWIHNDPELLVGSLVVDLSPSAEDLLIDRGLQQSSTIEEFCSLTHNPRTHEGNNPSATAEEGGANSGSVSFSSDSFGGSKLSQTSAQLGSQVHCVGGEKSELHASSVIFSSDSFHTNKVSEQQPLIASTAEISEDAGVQLLQGLNHTSKENSMRSLKKGYMRRKLPVRRKAPLNTDSNSHDFNMEYNSELVNSSNSNLEKEEEGPKKISFLGLTGIARGRLEQANITSKVQFDWEAVRLKYTEPEISKDQNENPHAGCKAFGSSSVENGVDWEAVKSAKLEDIANVIKERGMNNVLAGRIKAFLERVQKEHGSLDLEWLRTISVEESKSFLLSIRGLGLKSVECIRLLTLHHLAFPVDTNVGRICVRLGWVPLEPLPEELQLHLLELYPVQETIQKYLWPRLCSLDQRTLYELHYQMITFGKVFCTKSRPNCNACPMRDDCQHFASALSSARLALPAAAHDDAHSTNSEPLALPAAAAKFIQKAKLALPPLQQDATPEEEVPLLSKLNSFISSQKPCEPIIEEPGSPERVVSDVTEIEDIEQLPRGADEYDILVGVSSQPSGLSEDARLEVDVVLPPAEVSTLDTASKALVLLPPGIASLPVPKLKNVGRLRTVHYVYELPDHHPLLQEMDPREPDDPCVYLLAIWSPGESPEAPPVLDDLHTNGTCDGFNNGDEETVKGTVLVPCRTAMRGIFPLNGTYFQVNEVFADHASSLQPIEVPRKLLWTLRRRFVYFGTSVTTIFKGLSTEEIQACFWRGYVCVRGFDSITRCPRPLAARLHFPASKMIRKQKDEKDSSSNAKAEDED